MDIREDETLSPFIRGKIHIIQKKKGYRFNIDSILLSSFAKIKKKNGKIIDLGTGSGIVLLLISLKYKSLDFHALEIQESLFGIAKRNFQINHLKVNLIKGDVRDIKNIYPPHYFDYVITNPPYYSINSVKPKNKEISIAKFEIEAKTEDFIMAASYLLKDNGSFFMVNQSIRMPELIFLMKKNRLEPKRLRFIYPSIGENSTHFLVEAVKNAKEGCSVEKPLIIYKNPKEKVYTEEVNFILEKFTEG